MELYFRYALELALLLPAALFAILPVREHFRFPARRVWLGTGLLLLLLILGGAAIAMWQRVGRHVLLLAEVPLCFGVYCLAVDLPFLKKLFCFSNASMLTSFCILYTVFLIVPAEEPGGPFLLVSGLICLGLTLAIGAAFLHVFLVELPRILREGGLDRMWWLLGFLPLVITVFNIWSTPVSPAVIMAGRVRPIALVLMLLIPGVSLLLFFIFWRIIVQMSERARLQQENDLLQMEQKRYAELRSYMDETRALQHNFRQHLRVIDQLSRSGEGAKLRDYINSLKEDSVKSHRHYCANSAVDAIAAYYDHAATAQGVVIDWRLDLPAVLPMREVDYCAVLGNLLENALRALEEEPPEKKRVTVLSSMLSEAMLGLSVDNPFSGKLRRGRDGLPKTDKSGHGLGLSSVAATVRRYSGTIEVKHEAEVFSVNLLFYFR